MKARRVRNNSLGAVIVETTIIFPVLVLLTLSALDLTRYLQSYMIMGRLNYEIARAIDQANALFQLDGKTTHPLLKERIDELIAGTSFREKDTIEYRFEVFELLAESPTSKALLAANIIISSQVKSILGYKFTIESNLVTPLTITEIKMP